MVCAAVNARPQSGQDCSTQTSIFLDIVDEKRAAGDIRFQLRPEAILASSADARDPGIGITGQLFEPAQDN